MLIICPIEVEKIFAPSVLLIRPFLNGHARLNGRLGNVARFCPFFCDSARFFVILVILNGVRYAQIKRTNDKTINKNTPTMKRTTKNTSARFSLQKCQFRQFFARFLAKKTPVFRPFFLEKGSV